MSRELRRIVGFFVIVALLAGGYYIIYFLTNEKGGIGDEIKVEENSVADIRIDTVEVINSIVCKGRNVQFKIIVKNVGNVDVEQFQLWLFKNKVDGIPDEHSNDFSLRAGSSKVYSINSIYKDNQPSYQSQIVASWPMDKNPHDNSFSMPIRYSYLCGKTSDLVLKNPTQRIKKMMFSVRTPSGEIKKEIYDVQPGQELIIPTLTSNLALERNRNIQNIEILSRPSHNRVNQNMLNVPDSNNN